MTDTPMTPDQPTPVELTEQQMEPLIDAGNRALNDHYHEAQCHCDDWPASCVSSGHYFMGAWDTDAFAIGVPAVLGVWETLRNDRYAAKVAELRADNEQLRARIAELKALTPTRRDPRGDEMVRRMLRPDACKSCGDIPAEWCPDCAACRQGCHGGHDNNPCTHPNAPWNKAATP
ncbi:hypothetical protein AB0387_26115 [Streptomyces sp. NPDC089173]|uniref:hypothetical protein n=1 Tax=Streptomyces sp. NPDC089173 TaxID=3154965 RepID=UPI00344FE96E